MDRPLPLLLLLGVGCTAPALDAKFGDETDSDGDGLFDADEYALGTDPDVADSDGDGTPDGLEVDEGSDPTDPADKPYTGGWGRDACRDSLTATGNAVGEVTDNFALSDQHGDTVKLHDFCARAVLLVNAAFW
jgi:hypothetical protein